MESNVRKTMAKVERILERGRKRAKSRDAGYRIDEITLHCDGYAEPGYSDPSSGVIAWGNWNSITKYDPQTNQFSTIDDTLPWIAERLEKIGVELEWCDEWCECEECHKIVRTSPDSYGWQRSYWQDECTILCADCVRENPDDYIASLEGNSRSCVTFDLDLTAHGYVLLESGFENGFHPGQNADPKVIAKSLRSLGVERFIFDLTSVGQFDMEFAVYVHRDEFERIDVAKWSELPKDGHDVSAALQRSLQSASIELAKLPDGPGVKVAKCNSDGTASARLVSPQDFIDGKALDADGSVE